MTLDTWTRAFCRVCLAVLILAATGSGSAPGQSARAPRVEGELLVKFRGAAAPSERASVRAQLAAEKLREFRSGAEHWKLGRGRSVDQAIEALRHNPGVEYAEPNYLVQLDVAPNDPSYPSLWGLNNAGQTGGTPGADIDAERAWGVITGSRSVRVAVIDTGIDYTHPDLAANVWTNPGEIPGNGIDDEQNGFIDDVHGWDFVNDDNDPMDDNGHGTHCSGTIGAVGDNGVGVAGVSWQVTLVGLKFLNSGGSGSLDDAVSAIDYATSLGVDITSNSWGCHGCFSQTLLDSIQAAAAANVLFVAAAGNAGLDTDITPHYPSAYDAPNIVAVAATDHNDALASFSNYGRTTVDLGAPGVDILSTFPAGQYGLLSGTSMATPHVAGVSALIRALSPGIGVVALRQLLLLAADPVPALAGITVSGGRLNAFFALAEPDDTPPGAIVDLAVTEATSNSLMLQWSATGDDGEVGTATSYDLRYSTSPIDETSFAAATHAPGPSTPQPAGGVETTEVFGLVPNTTYHFAVKALDEWGNAGPLGNVASGVTLPPPTLAWSPSAIEAALLTGQTTTRTLTVTNAGVGTLDWSLDLVTSSTAAVVQHEPLLLDKGEPDPRQGAPGTEGAGGPDGFGYRWTDSDSPGGPSFTWLDIAATGTPVAGLSGDDQTSAPIPLGFDFPFYGGLFDSVRVSTNGFLSFTSASTSYTNQPLPSVAAPENLIAGFWDDLHFRGTPRAAYRFLEGPDGRTGLVVQYTDVDLYYAAANLTFQIELRRSGEIRLRYLSMSGPLAGATVGIQNATQDDGLTVAFNQLYVHDALEVRLLTRPKWLFAAPTSGRLGAGESRDVALTFDAVELDGGTYRADATILSNDPLFPVAAVPVTLHVTGAPNILVEGPGVTLESAQDYAVDAAVTAHALPIGATPAGGGSIELVAEGDFADATERATLHAEGRSLGSVGAAGVDCTAVSGRFDLDARELGDLVADGVVQVEVRNTASVGAACGTNRHQVRLHYNRQVDPLDFGTVFVAGSRALTLTVRNSGSESLDVASIGVDRPEFTVSDLALAVPPHDQRTLVVTFRPTAVDPVSGRLTLSSNDPDRPTLELVLRGEGLLPPEIDVSPASVSADLLTGETTTRTVTVSNLGASDLTFAAGIGLPAQPAALALPPGLLEAVAPTAGATTTDAAGAASVPSVPVSLAGADVLLVEDFLPWGTTSNEQLLAANGIAFDRIGSSALSGTDLTRYGVVLVASDQSTAAYNAIAGQAARLSDFVTGGGVLEFHAAGWGWQGGDASVVTLPRGMTIEQWYAGWNYVVNPGHPLVAGVPSLFEGGYASHASFSNVPAGATVVATDDMGQPNLVAYRVGAGWVVAGGQTFEYAWAYGQPAGTILANMLPFSHGLRSRWLAVTPAGGVVPPGGSIDLTLALDATGLFGGDYDADVVVTSNDLDEPEVRVSAQLHVTGAPDIRVSATALDFGALFVGASSSRTLTVTNDGTDTLTATLEVAPAEFSVDPTSLTIPPLESRDVTVTFRPALPVPGSGTLTVASNDPDEGTVAVALSGAGLVAPDVEIAPPSFQESLFSGETVTRTLTIGNTGGNDLTFDISTATVDPALEAAETYAVPGLAEAGTNRPDGAGPVRGARRVYTGSAPTLAAQPAILVYADDVQRAPGDHYVDRALQSLGLAYTAYYSDPYGFGSALVTGSWDLVVVDHNNFYELGQSWTEIESFVQAGGRLLVSTFDVDGSHSEPTTLWDTLGVLPRSGLTVASPVTWWDRANPIFHTPESVPDFLTMQGAYLDHGDAVDAAPPGHTVAGFHADLTPAQGAITLAGSARAIVNSFLVVENLADRDGDGKPDAQELLTNEIAYLAGPTWLAVNPTYGTVPPGGSVDVQVTIDATGRFGGDYDAALEIATNDPDEPNPTVPVHLHVTGVPDIAIRVAPEIVESTRDYSTIAAITTHALPLSIPPAGGGTIELVADGDYGQPGETATLSTEGLTLGSVGVVGSDCAPAAGGFVLSAEQLAGLAADGVVRAEVQNSLPVDLFCAVNRHTVRLLYERSASPLDFGALFLGLTRTLSIFVDNPGTEVLRVTAIGTSHADFVPSAATLAVPPHGSAELIVAFAPSAAGVADALLTLESDDPDEPTMTVPLRGEGRLPPDLDVSPSSLSETLPLGGTRTRTVALENRGAGDLDFTAAVEGNPAIFSVTPGAGTVAAGTTLDLQVAFDARTLDAGDYAATLRILSNDPDESNVGLPLSLHAFGIPEIDVSPPLLDYALVYTGFSRTLSIQVSNPGTDVLVVGVAASDPAFTPAAATLQVARGTTRSLSVTFAPLDARSYDATLTLTSNDADEPVVALSLLGVALVPPDVDVTPTSLAAELLTGQTATRELSLANRGGSDLAWHVAAQAVPWLHLEPTSGTVAGGAIVSALVTFDARRLPAGGYQHELVLDSNDPDEPRVTVPLRLTVTAAPDIEASATQLDFGTVFTGGSRSLQLGVTNAGMLALAVSDIAADVAHFSAAPPSFVLQPGQTQLVTVTFTPPGPGSFPASLVVTSNDPDEPALPVALSGLAVDPPIVEVSPSALEAWSLPGQVQSRTLSLANTGASALDFWLDVRAAGELPSGCVIAWTTAYDTGALLAVDVASGQVTTTAAGLHGPFDVEVAGTRAFVTGYDGGEISIVDLTTQAVETVVGGLATPWGVAVGPAGTVAYVTENGAGRLDAVDLSDGTVTVLAEGLSGPAGIALDPGGTRAYFVEIGTFPGRLLSIELDSGATTVVADGFVVPTDVVIDATGTVAYVVDSGAAALFAVHLATGTSTPIAGGLAGPFGVDLSADGMRAYVTEGDGGTLASVDLATGQVTSVASNLGIPTGIAVSTNPHCAGGFLALSPRSGSIPAGGRLEVAATFDGAGLPHATYDVDLVVSSNDPVRPELRVPVTLVVRTNEAPVARAGADVVAGCTSVAGAPVALDGAGSSDADSTAGTSDDIVLYEWFADYGQPGQASLGSGSRPVITLPLGARILTLRVSDHFGATSTDEVAVTVHDPAPPAIACPSAAVLECPSETSRSVTGDASAEDACGAVALTWSDATSPGCGGTSSTQRTWTATDASGNTASCTQSIEVVDRTPPAPHLPPALAPECSAAGGVAGGDPGIAAWFAAATAEDACGPASLTHDAPAFFPLGPTTVAFHAEDACGNAADAHSTVLVVDTLAPTLALTLGHEMLWPPDHRLVDVPVSVDASDACGPPAVVLGAVTSSEPDDADGTGDGATTGDVQDAAAGTPDFAFALRAERSGLGSGRTYAVTYVATDAAGHATSAVRTISVPHDQGGSVEPLVLRLRETVAGTAIDWTAVPGARRYEVIQGDLAQIRDAGTYYGLGSVLCLEAASTDETTAGGAEDPEIPPPGTAFFYLVAYDDGNAPSYGTESAAKPRIPGRGACN